MGQRSDAGSLDLATIMQIQWRLALRNVLAILSVTASAGYISGALVGFTESRDPIIPSERL